MREKRKRRFCKERRRAVILAVILCTSTALADNAVVTYESSGAAQQTPIVQQVEPLAIAQSDRSDKQPLEAKMLQHPPLPLLSNQQRSNRVHPFLESAKSPESKVRLTSGLADFIRGSLSQQPPQKTTEQGQKIKLVVPSNSAPPSDRVEVPPKPARRLAEPSFAAKAEAARHREELSLADRLRAEGERIGEQRHSPSEQLASQSSTAADGSEASATITEAQPAKHRKTGQLQASLATTPISGGSPANLIGASPRIQKVLPLPATASETPLETSKELQHEPVLFSLTDQSSSSVTPVQDDSTEQTELQATGISFSLSDQADENSVVAADTQSETRQANSVPDETTTAVKDDSETSETSETRQPDRRTPSKVESLAGKSKHPLSNDSTTQADVSDTELSLPVESIAEDTTKQKKTLASPPVILQRPVVTLTQVPQITAPDSNERSSTDADGLLQLPSQLANLETEDNAAIALSESGQPSNAKARIENELLASVDNDVQADSEISSEKSAVADLHEAIQDSIQAQDSEETTPPSFETAVAQSAPVSEINLPKADADKTITPSDPTFVNAPPAAPHRHSKTRDAIVGPPQPWSLSWLLANQDTKIIAPVNSPEKAQQSKVAPEAIEEPSQSIESAEQESLVDSNEPRYQEDPQDSNLASNNENSTDDLNHAHQSRLVDAAVSDANPQAIPKSSDALVQKPDSLVRMEDPAVIQSPAVHSLASSQLSKQGDTNSDQLPSPRIEVEGLVESTESIDSRTAIATHRVAPVAISAVPVKLQNRGAEAPENVNRQIQISPALMVGIESQDTIGNDASQSYAQQITPSRFAPQVKRVPLYMKRAQVRSLTVAGELQDVRIGDTSICQVVVVGPNRIKLIAAGSGVTELMVWAATDAQDQPVRMRIFKVHVENVDPSVATGGRTTQMLHEAIRDAFPDSNIVISHQGAELIVSGRCRTQDDAEKIIRMVRSTCLVTVQDRLTVD